MYFHRFQVRLRTPKELKTYGGVRDVKTRFAGLGGSAGPQNMIYDSQSMLRETMIHAPERLLRTTGEFRSAAGNEKGGNVA